jgi:hypothetical protein
MKAIMSDTLKKILSNKQEREELNEALQKFHRGDYSISRIGNKYYTIKSLRKS